VRRLRLGLPERLAEPQLASRLAWLTGLRIALLTLLLALTGSFYLRSGFRPGSYSGNVVLGTLAVAYALAGAYAAVLRRGERLVELAQVQLVLDQLTWTALVYVSGSPA
jgi:two-component system sensor histidine kinase HydH